MEVNSHRDVKLAMRFIAQWPAGKCWRRKAQLQVVIPGARLPGFKSRFWYLLVIGVCLVYLPVPQLPHQQNRRVRISPLHKFLFVET